MNCGSDGGSHEPVMTRYRDDYPWRTMFVLAALDRDIDGVPHRHAICKHCKCLFWMPEALARLAEKLAERPENR